MKKVIFTTNMVRSGTGMFVSVDEDNNFHDLIFVAVNHYPASALYCYFIDGDINTNGRTFTDAETAWLELVGYLGAIEIYPIKERQLKQWFGDGYKLKLAEFKDNLSETKMKEREAKKLKSKKQSGGLWLKGAGRFWN